MVKRFHAAKNVAETSEMPDKQKVQGRSDICPV